MSKPEFTLHNYTRVDNIYDSSVKPILNQFTIKANSGDLKIGTIMAWDTTSYAKLIQMDSDGSAPQNVPACILAQDVNDSTTDTDNVECYVSGLFFANKLIVDSDGTVGDFRRLMRNIGIYIVED